MPGCFKLLDCLLKVSRSLWKTVSLFKMLVLSIQFLCIRNVIYYSALLLLNAIRRFKEMVLYPTERLIGILHVINTVVMINTR